MRLKIAILIAGMAAFAGGFTPTAADANDQVKVGNAGPGVDELSSADRAADVRVRRVRRHYARRHYVKHITITEAACASVVFPRHPLCEGPTYVPYYPYGFYGSRWSYWSYY